MKPNKKINLKAYHFEIQKSKIVFWGHRGGMDSRRYEIHIDLGHNSEHWFRPIAEECIREIRKRGEALLEIVSKIKSA